MPYRNIDNFDLISNNIVNNEGCGVALYNKKKLKLHLLNFREQFCEDVWAAIKLQGGEKLNRWMYS